MTTKKYITLILGVCGLLAISILVTNTESTSSEPTNSYIVLESQDFAKYITDKEAVVIDVRTPAEFASGHLSGALNIDSSAPDFQEQLNALDKSKAYAVYCRSGNRSATALKTMRGLNFAAVADLGGGILAWERNRLPICVSSLTC